MTEEHIGCLKKIQGVKIKRLVSWMESRKKVHLYLKDFEKYQNSRNGMQLTLNEFCRHWSPEKWWWDEVFPTLIISSSSRVSFQLLHSPETWSLQGVSHSALIGSRLMPTTRHHITTPICYSQSRPCRYRINSRNANSTYRDNWFHIISMTSSSMYLSWPQCDTLG